MATSIRELINERIMTDIIKSTRSSDYKVLVLDPHATKILSSCCKMTDIMSENIMLIEDLMKKRQPMRSKDVVYFLQPNEDSIRKLCTDWQSPNKLMYRQAHLFFTSQVSDTAFNEIASSNLSKHIQTFKEVNISFVALEKLVFDIDQQETFNTLFSSISNDTSINHYLEFIADQLATTLTSLEEFPTIRAYKQPHEQQKQSLSERLAQVLCQKLLRYKGQDPSFQSESEKTQLLILDRSYDMITPLLHDLTYQSMINDFVCPPNPKGGTADVYMYEKQLPNGDRKLTEVPLDDDDKLWVELRHNHIASVSNQIPEAIKKFSAEKQIKGLNKENVTIRELTQVVRKMPEYQKELAKYELHFHLAEKAMQVYNQAIEPLCKIEQDLATGSDQQYNKLREPMRDIVPILLNQSLDSSDKIRIILLYILYKGKISNSDLDKLVNHANLSQKSRQTIFNYEKLGLPLFNSSYSSFPGDSRGICGGYLRKKDRISEIHFAMSRWIPALKDIIEYAMEGKLDNRLFPVVHEGSKGSSGSSLSVRPNKMNRWETRTPTKPNRVIVFIIGGMCSSEMRVCYEITKKYENNSQTKTNSLRPQKARNELSARKGGLKTTNSFNAGDQWEVFLGSTGKINAQMLLDEVAKLN